MRGMEGRDGTEELGGGDDVGADVPLLRELGQTAHELSLSFAQYTGISPARCALLALLGVRGELSQAALQRRLGVDSSVITRQVKALEAEGLLARRPDPTDNRFTLVSLTDTGRETTAHLDAASHAFQRVLLTGTSGADVEATRRFVRHIRDNARRARAGDAEDVALPTGAGSCSRSPAHPVPF